MGIPIVFLSTELPMGMLLCVWLASSVSVLTSILLRCENSENVSRPKRRLLFLREFPIWPKWSSDINASKCVRLLRNSKYFSRDVLTSDATTKIFHCPSLGWVFSQTNRNKEKAWHTLLAYYLLIDIVQSVWLCAFTWQWVIQLTL